MSPMSPEQRKEYDKHYRLLNHAKRIAQHKRYYKENHAKLLADKKIYKLNNPEQVAKDHKGTMLYNRENHRKEKFILKKAVIEGYGGKCECCGEHRYEFLAIDHRNNDGSKERDEGFTGIKFLKKILKDGFPHKYRILCHNCNSARGSFGYCPHEFERERAIEKAKEFPEEFPIEEAMVLVGTAS